MGRAKIYETEEQRADARRKANYLYREKLKQNPELLQFAREKAREYQRKSYEKHRDRICERNRAYYHSKKEQETTPAEE